MKKFMALYMAPAASIEQMRAMPSEETREIMEAWTDWGEAYAGHVVTMGSPLGSTLRVTAGGTSDTHNEVTGYSIVEGESREDVAKIFDGHPHLEIAGASIDIMECVTLPGMGTGGDE